MGKRAFINWPSRQVSVGDSFSLRVPGTKDGKPAALIDLDEAKGDYEQRDKVRIELSEPVWVDDPVVVAGVHLGPHWHAEGRVAEVFG